MKALTVIVAIFLTIGNVSPGNIGEYQKISVQQAQELYSENVLIVDVRGEAAYSRRHVKNALSLPVDEIAEKAESILPNKEQAIFVYCTSGLNSEQASKKLIEMGYINIYDIGKLDDWAGEFEEE